MVQAMTVCRTKTQKFKEETMETTTEPSKRKAWIRIAGPLPFTFTFPRVRLCFCAPVGSFFGLGSLARRLCFHSFPIPLTFFVCCVSKFQ